MFFCICTLLIGGNKEILLLLTYLLYLFIYLFIYPFIFYSFVHLFVVWDCLAVVWMIFFSVTSSGCGELVCSLWSAISWPRYYKTLVQSQTQNKAQ